jgi:Uma2 family endonuclease
MDTITNPSVVIEILSKSTRDYDRGTKFNLYRSIKTLKEYILVDSTGVSVEIFTRQQDERWILSEYKNLLEYFTITTIDLKILLADVYEAVRFDE